MPLLNLLGHNLGDLPEHDSGISVEEGDTGKTLAALEAVNDERVLRLELNLRSLVRLERVRRLELLASSLLADLPVNLGHPACGAAAAHKADWRVANLELARDIERLDLRGEGLGGLERRVTLVDHDVTNARHVLLGETLDVHADIVAWSSLIDALVVHLDGEHLAGAWRSGGVRREENNLLVRLDDTLLDTAGEHITDTLDLVDAGNRRPHRRGLVPRRLEDHLLEAVEHGLDVEFALVRHLDVDTAPPAHVGGLLDEVVTHPAGDREHWHAVLDEVLLPAHLHEAVLDLVADLLVAVLAVLGDIAVHLVHANEELLDTEEVEKTRVLASLALHLAGLVVALLDRGGEVTVGRDHEERDISLRCAGDHVLDEIPMARGVDDGVVPRVGEELLGGARDGHTTLTLLLLPVHVEGEGEGRLAERIGLGLELLELTLRDTSELENETASGRRLAGVDVSANNNGKVLLAFCHLHIV